MNQILTVALKDLALLRRDKMGLFWIFIFPLIYAVFFGALTGGSECRLRVEMMPGADHALARRDMVEAGGHQRLGGQPAGGDLLRGGAGGEGERVGHRGLPPGANTSQRQISRIPAAGSACRIAIDPKFHE